MTDRIHLALLVGAAFCLRCVTLDQQSFSVDESMSLLVSLDWRHAGSLDVHPPLFYLLVHLWSMLGSTFWWLRFSSVLAGTLCIPVLFGLLGEAGWPRAERWAPCWMLATSTYAVQYSRELRMYPLLSLEVALGVLCLFAWRNRPWAGAAYAVLAVAAAYTHYFGIFLTLLGPFILPRRLWSRCTMVAVGVALALLPWALSVYKLQSQQDFGLRIRPPLLALPETVGRIFAGDIGAQGNVALAILGFVALILIRPRRWALGWGLFPLLAVWLESRFGPVSVFEFKYFLWLAPAWFVLLRPHKALLALFVAANLAGQIYLHQSANFTSQDWQGVAAFLRAQPVQTVLVEPSMMASGLLVAGIPPQAMHPVDELGQVVPLMRANRQLLLITTPYHPAAKRLALSAFLARNGRLTTVREWNSSLPSAVVRAELWEEVSPNPSKKP